MRCDRVMLLVGEDGSTRTYPLLAGQETQPTYVIDGVRYTRTSVLTSEDVPAGQVVDRDAGQSGDIAARLTNH